MDRRGHGASGDNPAFSIERGLSPPWLTDTSRRLQHALPNSRLVELPGQAHDAYLTDPQAMAEAILPAILKHTG